MTYHWKQTHWNRYRLIGPNTVQEFNNYSDLYAYCQKHHIDAVQV